MKFSLLIATLNRPGMLKTCVAGLLDQTYSNYEIIIVDQSDKEYCDRSIVNMDDRINYIHISKKGLSHARNVGLNYVTGDYVCLIDDDALYDDNYLRLSAKIIDETEPTVLIGMLIDPITKEPLSNLNDGKIHWHNVFKGLCSACMILDARFLKSVKFDERFGVGSTYGSGEESDVIMYALVNDKKVYYTRKIRMYHRNPNAEEIPLKKIASYSYGAGALFKKTVKNYSRFWGYYHFARMIIANFRLLILQKLKRNQKAEQVRKIQVIYTFKGFLNYK